MAPGGPYGASKHSSSAACCGRHVHSKHHQSCIAYTAADSHPSCSQAALDFTVPISPDILCRLSQKWLPRPAPGCGTAQSTRCAAPHKAVSGWMLHRTSPVWGATKRLIGLWAGLWAVLQACCAAWNPVTVGSPPHSEVCRAPVLCGSIVLLALGRWGSCLLRDCTQQQVVHHYWW